MDKKPEIYGGHVKENILPYGACITQLVEQKNLNINRVIVPKQCIICLEDLKLYYG